MRNKFPWNMLLGLDPNLVGSPFRNKQKSAELEMFLQQHQKRQVPTSAKLRYLARFFLSVFFGGSSYDLQLMDRSIPRQPWMERTDRHHPRDMRWASAKPEEWHDWKAHWKNKTYIDRSWDSNRYPGPSTRLMKKLQFVTKQGFHLRNVWTNSILK